MFSYKLDEDTELRLLQEYDAEEFFILTDENREHLRRWLPWLDTTRSVYDTRAFIHSTLLQFANNKGFQAGIWYRGSLAGIIGYHSIDQQNRKTAIGYWLGEAFTGKGLMTKACEALLDYGFDVLQLNRIEIRCAPSNTRSCAIPQRLGFTHEGIAHQAEWLYDHFVDQSIYSMLASDWRTIRAARRS